MRVSKRTRARTVVVDEPLTRSRVDVKRIAVNRVVDTKPETRHDGDTIVVPVVEEIVVVTRRYRIVEELHVRRHSESFRRPQKVVLGHEEGIVERLPVGNKSTTGRREGGSRRGS